MKSKLIKLKKKISLSLAKKFLSGEIKDLLSLRNDYLTRTGWINSLRQKECLDANKNPIAWFSYPALHFLESRLERGMNVFEFGSGNSTLYFASRCNSVYSVESDLDWFQLVSKKVKNLEKVRITHSQGKDYYEIRKEFDFDIVVIDGIYRNECCKSAIKMLSKSGVIILDNAERLEYNDGMNLLRKNGFKRVSFFGLAPLNHYAQDTSIFYRDNNCFNL